METDVIIIGGGASGMMAAGTAAKRYKNVKLFEKNKILGRKILITGKGRCNVTNSSDISEFFDKIFTNSNFLYSAFYTFTNDALVDFFEGKGVKLKSERGNRVFPESDKSADIVNALKKYLHDNNVEIVSNEVEDILIEEGKIVGVIVDKKEIKCNKVIIATGGMSYPSTGSTGDGYKFAKKAGHKIMDLSPALVPLETKEIYDELQGLSLKNVSVSLIDEKNKVLYDEQGEMIFTHFGVSGPLILSLSGHLPKHNSTYRIKIDLKPALSYEQLDARILRDFSKYQNKDFKNSLNDLLPKNMIPVVIKLSKISPDTKVNQITKEQRQTLVELLKAFTLTFKKKRPLEEAIITDGGVCTKEINPSTMESKLVKGLYFTGEVIDVCAYTGGYNLQIAFSTGYLAGISV